MNMLTVITDPLWPARCAQSSGKPAFDHSVRRSLTPLDSRHDGQRTSVSLCLHKIAQSAPRIREVFSRNVQLGEQHFCLRIVRIGLCQSTEALDTFVWCFVRNNFSKCARKVRVWTRSPSLRNNARRVFWLALLNIAFRRHNSRRN